MTSQNTSACLINDEDKGIKGFKGMKHLLIIGAACWLGACSNTPPVSTTWEAYTQPKEQQEVALLICDAEGEAASVRSGNAYKPSFKTGHSTLCNGYECKTIERVGAWSSVDDVFAKSLVTAKAKTSAVTACMLHLGFKGTNT
jgi:hypothetical protein